jgi:hypothetical protein
MDVKKQEQEDEVNAGQRCKAQQARAALRDGKDREARDAEHQAQALAREEAQAEGEEHLQKRVS